MGDDKEEDSTNDAEGEGKGESGDEETAGSTGSPAPGDDDIIIK